MDTDLAVERLFSEQHRLATRDQLYGLGVTQEALRWRLGRSWTLVLSRVVARTPERLSSRQRLVAAHTEDEASAVVIEAVQRRRCTIAELSHELEAGPRKGSAFARRALTYAADGAWSMPEATLLRGCGRSRVLPPACANPTLTIHGIALVSPDLWFDDVALAVMVHSRTHHERGSDWERTVQRDGELTEHGVTVLAFTPRAIATDLERVVATIERTYVMLSRARRPRPEVLMTPRWFTG
jgi:hypothetical protein